MLAAYAPLRGCRIACSAISGVHDSAAFMASHLGASWAFGVELDTTHLLVTDANDATAATARKFCPWVHIVHVHWLCKCYRRHERADERRYDAAFYVSARRTGTRTALGSKDTFFAEVGLFHAVESLLPSFIQAPLRHVLLGNVGYDPREHPIWPTACRYLQHTIFWGPLIRERNWRARRHLIMAIESDGAASRRPRKRPRDCQDGPAHVLRRVAQLPKELRRIVVEFV